MPKNRHHFVPRFYLKFFGCNDKQIHVYNLNGRKTIENVSLRDQCYKHKMYGKTDIVEDRLALLEGHFASTIKNVIRNSELPNYMSKEYIDLLVFIAVQHQRTSVASKLVNEYANKFMKRIITDHHEGKIPKLDNIQIEHQEPAAYALSFLPVIVMGMIDLKLHLVCASDDQSFITSDNPVYYYNQYFEDIKDFGKNGIINRGIQMFVPLSPKHLLILYDGSIYKTGNKNPNITYNHTDKDINQLNAMQIISADNNVYFNNALLSNKIYVMHQDASQYRDKNKVIVETFNKSSHSISIHAYQDTPNLKLDLSFMQIKRDARRKSINERFEPAFLHRKIRAVDEILDNYSPKYIIENNKPRPFIESQNREAK